MSFCARLSARLALAGCFLLLLSLRVTADEAPSIRGLVPAFAERKLSKTFAERRYYDVRYPQFGNEHIDEAIRMFAESLAGEVSEPDDAEDAPIVDRIDVGYELTAPSSRYLSVVFSAWHDFGGAHPSWNLYAFTFDLGTGEELRISDLFVNGEQAFQRLPALIRESAAEAGCASGDLRFFPNAFGGDEFYLDPEGAVFVFNTYDSAMWEHNTIGVTKERLLEIGARPELWKP